MKKNGIFVVIIYFSLILLLCTAHAGEMEKTWSFEFNGSTLRDALDILSKTTGIKIFPTSHVDKIITSEYNNDRIEYILDNIFKGINHALLWKYNNEKLSSVEIWIFDPIKPKNNFSVYQNKSISNVTHSSYSNAPSLNKSAGVANNKSSQQTSVSQNQTTNSTSNVKDSPVDNSGNNSEKRTSLDSTANSYSGTGISSSSSNSESISNNITESEGLSPALYSDTVSGVSESETDEVSSLTASLEPPESFRMPISEAFYAGVDTVGVKGQVESGVLYTGDEVEIIGLGKPPLRSTVQQLTIGGIPAEQAGTGDEATMTLTGIETLDIVGGVLVAASGEETSEALESHTSFMAILYILEEKKNLFDNLFSQEELQKIHIGTTSVTGECTYLNESGPVFSEDGGGYAFVLVELSTPAPSQTGQWFDIIANGQVIATGQILGFGI